MAAEMTALDDGDSDMELGAGMRCIPYMYMYINVHVQPLCYCVRIIKSLSSVLASPLSSGLSGGSRAGRMWSHGNDITVASYMQEPMLAWFWV